MSCYMWFTVCQKLLCLWIPQGFSSLSQWTSIQWLNLFKSRFHIHSQPRSPVDKASLCWEVTGEKEQGWPLLTDIQAYSLDFHLGGLGVRLTHMTLMVNFDLPNKPQHLFCRCDYTLIHDPGLCYWISRIIKFIFIFQHAPIIKSGSAEHPPAVYYCSDYRHISQICCG